MIMGVRYIGIRINGKNLKDRKQEMLNEINKQRELMFESEKEIIKWKMEIEEDKKKSEEIMKSICKI